MSFHRGRVRGTFLLMFVLLLALAAAPVLGQAAPTPINVNQQLTGEVSAANIAPAFLYTAPEPQSIQIQVQSLTTQFAPALRVLNQAGILVEDIPNDGKTDRLDTVIILPQAGQYLIQVYSASGFGGQFSLTIPEALPAPQPLAVGQVLDVNLSPSTATVRFAFNADSQNKLALIVRSDTPANATASLDGEAGDELARVSLRLTGLQIDIPAGSGGYVLTLFQSVDAAPETVRVSLVQAQVATPTPVPAASPIPQPTSIPLQPLPSTGPCVVASFSGGQVNLRGGPGTNFNIVGQIGGNQTLQVIGRLSDNSWLQVSFNGTPVWIATSVTRQGGDCSQVPVVNLPGAPTATPAPSNPGTGPADLSVGGVSISPASPAEDTDFAVNVTVNNTGGTAAVNVLVRISFSSSDLNVSAPSTEATIPNIPANSAVTVNFIGIRGDEGGTINGTVTLNPNNGVPETNEGNNTSSFQITVQSNDPDLIVDSISMDTPDGSTAVTIHYTIRNQGLEDADNFTLTFTFDPAGAPAQNVNFSGLNAGDSITQTLGPIDLGANGDYTITGEVDSGDTVDEAHESNNTKSLDFRVG